MDRIGEGFSFSKLTQLRERIRDDRGNITEALINPKRLTGIGNGIDDDALFQAEDRDTEPALHLDKDTPHASSG